MNVESLIITLSYPALFLIMTATGFTGFFPGSKIPYIVAGYFSSTGQLSLAAAIISGALGHSLGNYFQYVVAKKYGIEAFDRYGVMPKDHVRAFQKTFEKRQKTWLFVGKIVDPIKLFIAICGGIAKTPLKTFIPLIVLGSIVWASIFTGLGYFFGKSFEDFKLVGIIILGVGLTVITIFMRQFNRTLETEGKSKKK